jgi:hypothetical protein
MSCMDAPGLPSFTLRWWLCRNKDGMTKKSNLVRMPYITME